MTNQRKSTAAHFLAKCSLLVIIIVGIGSIYAYTLTLPAGKGIDNQEFEISKGESVRTIATRLKTAHLIRSPLFFRLVVRQKNLTVQAGIYQLSPSQTPQTIAQTLTKGIAVDHKITIPEGYRIEQIAETAGIPTKEFVAAAAGLEGQLFPDTYFVKANITPAELVKILHDNFIKKVGTIDPQTLILASLVERETRGIPEKPIVAGILKKRLVAGWTLDLDATIQYVRGTQKEWWPNTTLLDRKTVSKYNTYLNQGLPPTPICNPGLAAINAARSPKESDYWFYLHDANGQIHYAATNAEQNQNIATYIR